MRKHKYREISGWRTFLWDTSMGELLKALNRRWRVKHHSYHAD